MERLEIHSYRHYHQFGPVDLFRMQLPMQPQISINWKRKLQYIAKRNKN